MKSPSSIYELTQRVRAGILQLTLGVSMVIAILCSAMILLAYYIKLSLIKSDIQNELRNNADSGIQVLMASRQEIPLGSTHILDLFDQGRDSVYVSRIPWGVFELYTARAVRGKSFFTRTALITALDSELTKLTLFMPENNATVYLAGNPVISGTVSVSERKFSSGSAGGRTFEGPTLLKGEFITSPSSMPTLDTTAFSLLQQLVDSSHPNVSVLQELPINQLLPFSGNRVNLFSTWDLVIISDSLQGNLIVHSDRSIQVRNTAFLSDVILVAPIIEVEEGFRGRAQFFAEKVIEIQEDVQLYYPSSLVLTGKLTDSLIHIQQRAKVEGQVIIPGIDRYTESGAVFQIDHYGALHGQAYINASSDIQGSVSGHLTTKQVRANVEGNVYYNHIYDGTLSFMEKSPFMPGPLLWGNGHPNQVARWIE